MNKVTIICTMIFMVGCSSDSVTNDTIIEKTTVEKRRSYLEIDEDGRMEILIVYVEGTPESVKNEVRVLYRQLLLISDIVQCEEDDKETWSTVARMPNPLTDTSSDEPLREVIQQVIFNANCDNDNARN
ncbi:hypothetical protein [uncultured Aquimarina sp.]|uniref:hypothetical protein n=1 Tax=uncultured Aquimarina sp. TaxID=575652 RepID=UPI00262BD5D5|nr:hypothetical protein [uncultured Aquimarina sp.]